jgi:hypothetical protein
MRACCAIVLLGACGPLPPDHPAPPAPAPIALAKVGDVAGRWSGADRDGWTYHLTIEPAGTFALALDRGAQGPCEEKGKVELSAPDRLAFTYETNTCNPSYTGATIQATVRSRSPFALAFPDAIIELSPVTSAAS